MVKLIESLKPKQVITIIKQLQYLECFVWVIVRIGAG
jgi:hypothetical protein